MRKLGVFTILVVLVFLVGCQQTIVCNEPYIIKGTDCCLDQDGNSVCDEDEVEVEEQENEESEQETEEEETDSDEEPTISLEEEEKSSETQGLYYTFYLDETQTIFDVEITLDKIGGSDGVATFYINGEKKTFEQTKLLEIIEGLYMFVQERNYMGSSSSDNYVVLKIEELGLEYNQYVVYKNFKVQTGDYFVLLTEAQSSGKIHLNVYDQGLITSDEGYVREGETEDFLDITITNMNSFYKEGQYAVIEINPIE
jgi:hypothetical protein